MKKKRQIFILQCDYRSFVTALLGDHLSWFHPSLFSFSFLSFCRRLVELNLIIPNRRLECIMPNSTATTIYLPHGGRWESEHSWPNYCGNRMLSINSTWNKTKTHSVSCCRIFVQCLLFQWAHFDLRRWTLLFLLNYLMI